MSEIFQRKKQRNAVRNKSHVTTARSARQAAIKADARPLRRCVRACSRAMQREARDRSARNPGRLEK